MSETILLPLSIEPQEIVYQDKNQTIQRVIAQFDGFSKEYFVCDHGQRAAVVVVKDSKVLLTRQYRFLLNGLSYEIPGGRIDGKETPETAAMRECLEETGVLCAKLTPLIDYLPSLDIWENHTYIFYSEEAREIDKNKSEQRTWISLESCLDMVFAREITDSLSIIALLVYRTILNRR